MFAGAIGALGGAALTAGWGTTAIVIGAVPVPWCSRRSRPAGCTVNYSVRRDSGGSVGVTTAAAVGTSST